MMRRDFLNLLAAAMLLAPALPPAQAAAATYVVAQLHPDASDAKPGQRLYQWGCAWAPHKLYDTLSVVSEALGLEQDSRAAEVRFADWAELDLRVPADSPLLARNCYPRGEVPGVRLGVGTP